MTCEIGSNSKLVDGVLSCCKAIADKSVISTFLLGHLLLYFGKFPGREGTNVGRQTNSRIFDIAKLLIESEFYNSINIIVTTDVDDNEL